MKNYQLKHALRHAKVSVFLPWVILAACLLIQFQFTLGTSVTISSPLFNGGDGSYTQTTIGGQPAWQINAGSNYLYFDVPFSFTVPANGSVYLQVVYYDETEGRVGLQYDSKTSAYKSSEIHTRSSRLETNQFVMAYFELQQPGFYGRQNGNADFRICWDGKGSRLAVRSVTIQDTPFLDAQFQRALTKPWLQGTYSGPTKDYVDSTTLRDKVMAGYQGWFRTPNDMDDLGWNHWFTLGNSVTLSSPLFNGGDGCYTQTTLGGQLVWQINTGSLYLYFDVPSSFPVPASGSVYVQVIYYDETNGQIGLQYDNNNPAPNLPNYYTASEVNSRTSRQGTNQFVAAYFELKHPGFYGRQNGGADFRICWDGTGSRLAIKSVTIQDVPCFNGEVIPKNFSIDMWPDLTEYDPVSLCRAGSIMTRGGSPAYLFSSTYLEAVRLHFQWMRKHNIDGVFLQRFLDPSFLAPDGRPEWVLANVREAAHREGRIWAIEYDVSSLRDNNALDTLKKDWIWLVDTFKIKEDPLYCKESGKPVVFIWGLPFLDKGFQVGTANAIVDFFTENSKYGNNYVIGGIPNTWASLGSDWQSHLQKYHGLLVWQTGSYTTDFNTFTNNWHKDYYPHLWPGFSWANMKKQTGDTDLTRREGGTFYWNKINGAIGAGASRLFIGMFDEYDEGTAVMPMSDDSPNLCSQYGRFITNDGRPSDWWMMLTGEAKARLEKQRTITTIPTETELFNRSNIGPEVSIDLGNIDQNTFLYRVAVPDGRTSVETVAGKECRYNTAPATDLYMYFNVDDKFLNQETDGTDVTVEIEYYDQNNTARIGLQYDSINGAYTNHPKSITTQGAGIWRTVRFEISNAYFGNRQNYGADFRFTVTGKVDVNRVWVRLPQEEYKNWRAVDLGSVGVAGSAALDETTGVYMVKGSGADIWNSADGFTFYYKPMAGDGQIVARVDAVQNTDPWAKAGVMIRERLTPDSTHAMIAVSPGCGVSFQRRLATGGGSFQTTTGGLVAPQWLKLVRSGSSFSAYWSTDGNNWTLQGSETIAMGQVVYIGLAVTAHNNSLLNTSQFNRVRVKAKIWTLADVGNVGITGSGAVNPSTGVYTVKGSGADIWATADAFSFYCQPLSGDGQLVARVDSVQNTDPWAKAGVMIREKLTPDSKHAMMVLTPANGVSFQWRTTTGGNTGQQSTGGLTAPYWFKLVRSGSTFSAYRSVDGFSWVFQGSATITMEQSVYVGLAVTAHNNAALNTSTYSQVQVK